MPTDDTIVIKGIREGLLFTIKPDTDWQTITSRLTARIDEKRAFFKGARAAIDVGARPVVQQELDMLKALLTKREITLWAVVSASATTRGAATNLGLETALVTSQEQLDAPEISPEEIGSQGVLINHTLRSGRTIRSAGNVTVIGDVNPGAEIIAGGSIVVWGRLRGTVHAGAGGDETAIVCALDLAPTQLRIATFLTISPPENKRRKVRPEIASVQNGRIVAEAWEQ